MSRVFFVSVTSFVVLLLSLALTSAAAAPAKSAAIPPAIPPAVPTHWQWCGWGGGGFYWSAAYHPAKAGVLYMGGDVDGCYKSEDDGRHWRLANDGLSDYAVYGLAVDPASPDTVYAVTESGVCKSTDAAGHWVDLPETNKGKLDIVAERRVSVRPLAVDPADSNVVYAATPQGVVYKSEDGGQRWAQVFKISSSDGDSADGLRTDLPAGPPYYGGFLLPLTLPADAKSDDVRGIVLRIKSNGVVPRTAFVTVQGPGGAVYRSRSLTHLLEKTDWQDAVLATDDFSIDADAAGKHKEQAGHWPAHPDWKTINRLDFACSGTLKSLVVVFREIDFALPDGKKAVVRDFAHDRKVNAYGGLSTAGPKPAAFSGVSVAKKDPHLLLAASPQAGVFASRDAGRTWEGLAAAPKSARCVVADPGDANLLYGAFDADGVHKSADGGRTWTPLNDGIRKGVKIVEVAVNPARSAQLACIGAIDWNGFAYWSDNAGATWHEVNKLAPDPAANPTSGMNNLSTPTNVTWSPADPGKLYVSSNWRPVFSEDAGRTWQERDRGADISCVYDIRFSGGRTYAACMDEGVLFSDDDGNAWHQAWPRGGPGADKISGHYWRLAVSDHNGVNRIVSTCSPWDANAPNRVVLSEDGGKTFKATDAGLPTYRPHANTMWGMSYARALAADPKDPSGLYLGMDGDPEGPAKSGGGIFRSTDGGLTWKPLEHQPPARRTFFGLAVDPTDSKRLYWAACGAGGGLYRSDDAGESWQHVFKNEAWLFNVLVTPDGTVYAPGQNLWRSTDHGQTWKKLTNLPEGQIMGLEVHPRDSKTLWLSTVKHGGAAWGYILKTTDGGATWHDITGDIGYRKPTVLRFNPETSELWAGGVGLFKVRQ